MLPRSLLILMLLLLSPAAGLAAPPIDFTLRFEKGDTTTSTLTIETGQTDSPGQPSRQKNKSARAAEPKLQRAQKQHITLRTTVTDCADGIATLDSTIVSFTIDADSPALGLPGEQPGQRFIYDSKKPDKAQGLAPGQAGQLAELIGKSFRTTIEPSGKVRSVTGLENLAKIMTAPMDASPELAALAGALRASASDDALRQALAPGLSLLPAAPVQPNAHWTTTLTQPLPMIGAAESTWRSHLARVDRKGASKLATIDSEATITVNNTTGSSPLPASLVTFDQGSGTAQTTFDAGLGRAISSSMELRLPVSMKIPLDEPSQSIGQSNSIILVTRMRHTIAESASPPTEKPRHNRDH